MNSDIMQYYTTILTYVWGFMGSQALPGVPDPFYTILYYKNYTMCLISISSLMSLCMIHMGLYESAYYAIL